MGEVTRGGARSTGRLCPRRALTPGALLLSAVFALSACSQSLQTDPAPEPLSVCVRGHWSLDPEDSSSSAYKAGSEYSMRIDDSTITSNVFIPDTLDPQSGPMTLVMTGVVGEVTMEYELDDSVLVIGKTVSSSGLTDPGSDQAVEGTWRVGMSPGTRLAVTCEDSRFSLSYMDDASVTFVFVGGDDPPTDIAPESGKG